MIPGNVDDDIVLLALGTHVWYPIDTAPKDRLIRVFAPGTAFDLPDLVCPCQWHEDAGFCVCELRYPNSIV